MARREAKKNKPEPPNGDSVAWLIDVTHFLRSNVLVLGNFVAGDARHFDETAINAVAFKIRDINLELMRLMMHSIDTKPNIRAIVTEERRALIRAEVKRLAAAEDVG